MSYVSPAASVGAGLSRTGFSSATQAAQLKEQADPPKDPVSAAMMLIQRTLAVDGTVGRDLDVLA